MVPQLEQRGMKEFARVANWKIVSTAQTSLGQSSLNKYLQYEAHYHRLQWPAALSSDSSVSRRRMVEFFDMGFGQWRRHIELQIDTRGMAQRGQDQTPAEHKSSRVRASVWKHLVLKIDLENCSSSWCVRLWRRRTVRPHRTDLLIEWHLPRAAAMFLTQRSKDFLRRVNDKSDVALDVIYQHANQASRMWR